MSDGKGGPGFRRLKRHPDYPNMVQRTLEEQQRIINEVSHGRSERKPEVNSDYPATGGVNVRSRRYRGDRKT